MASGIDISLQIALLLTLGALCQWLAWRMRLPAILPLLLTGLLLGPGLGLLVPLVFVTIIGTVVVQSLTAGALARRLGLSSHGEQGVLITSSNRVALLLGEALKANAMICARCRPEFGAT